MSDNFKNRIILILIILVGLCVLCIINLQKQADYMIISSSEDHRSSAYSDNIDSENADSEITDAYKYRNENICDLSGYKPLVDEDGAWYTQYHFIAHAGGGIDGRTYTNSKEAWEYSYSQGNRVFDADLSFTSDGVLVLRHSWSDNLETNMSQSMNQSSTWIDDNGMIRNIIDTSSMTYDEFHNTKIFFEYASMDLEDMFQFMKTYNDVFVAIDFKDDVLDTIKYLVEYANKNSYLDVLDRIIISFYSYEDYYIIKDIYFFPQFMLRQYINEPHNYYEILDFCLKNAIHTVGISKCYINDEGVSLLKAYGIHVYVAIADYISDMKEYKELGADGAVTNWLYERDWQYVE